MGHNKEYYSLDKMTGKEICFSAGKVWREHKSLPLPAGFQPGLCPEPVFLLSLTVLIFSTFDLLSAVISLLFTFTITHLNLIKFKTLNTCSFPRFTVLLPPTLASGLRLIESSWTEATGDEQRASGSRRAGSIGSIRYKGEKELIKCQLCYPKQTLVASFPSKVNVNVFSFLVQLPVCNLCVGMYRNCNLQNLELMRIGGKIMGSWHEFPHLPGSTKQICD